NCSMVQVRGQCNQSLPPHSPSLVRSHSQAWAHLSVAAHLPSPTTALRPLRTSLLAKSSLAQAPLVSQVLLTSRIARPTALLVLAPPQHGALSQSEPLAQ